MAPSDVVRVVEIALAAWESIYEARRQRMGNALFDAIHPDWRAEKARQVRSGCTASSSALLAVAEVHSGKGIATEVVGFVTCYVPENGIGEIGNNAVHPDWQGRSIAPVMYRHVCDRLRERGVRFVRVQTGGDPAHAPARRAYEKAGFGICLPKVDYYQEL
jgi:ribosomal protein S18 acetylase RimI-like enzyme